MVTASSITVNYLPGVSTWAIHPPERIIRAVQVVVHMSVEFPSVGRAVASFEVQLVEDTVAKRISFESEVVDMANPEAVARNCFNIAEDWAEPVVGLEEVGCSSVTVAPFITAAVDTKLVVAASFVSGEVGTKPAVLKYFMTFIIIFTFIRSSY